MVKKEYDEKEYLEIMLKEMNDKDTTDNNIIRASEKYAKKIGVEDFEVEQWFVGEVMGVSIEEAIKHENDSDFWDRKIKEKIGQNWWEEIIEIRGY